MLSPRWWPGSGRGGDQPVEIGCGATGTAHGFLQFLGQRPHLLRGGSAVGAEPQLSSRAGEHAAPVGHDECRGQAVEDAQVLAQHCAIWSWKLETEAPPRCSGGHVARYRARVPGSRQHTGPNGRERERRRPGDRFTLVAPAGAVAVIVGALVVLAMTGSNERSTAQGTSAVSPDSPNGSVLLTQKGPFVNRRLTGRAGRGSSRWRR